MMAWCIYPNCKQVNPDGRRSLCEDHYSEFPYIERPGPLDTPCHHALMATNHTGYGRLNREGKQWSAHRYAWWRAHGEIPASMLVLHHCDTPICVNVGHLYLGTFAQNAADRIERGHIASNRDRNWKISLVRTAPAELLSAAMSALEANDPTMVRSLRR